MIKRYLFICFVLFFTKGYGQKAKPKVVYETIVVYDTVTVYDTITIYDTIKVEKKALSENNFKNNFTAENAYLAIDTANFNATLLLINKKDTATLSINSIILSETNKNLDTMKKSLLTLLVSAALIQAAKSQDSVNVKSANSPAVYTVSAGGTVAFRSVNMARFYGANFKVDKVVGKKGKLTLGLSTDLGALYKGGLESRPDFPGASNEDVKLTGTMGNLFLTSSYYFVGNTSKEKCAMYVNLGIGTVLMRASQNKDNYKGANVSVRLGIGTEFKLGKGKIFTELLGSTTVFENVTAKYTDYNGADYENNNKFSIFDKNNNLSWAGWSGDSETPMLRIGYKLNL